MKACQHKWQITGTGGVPTPSKMPKNKAKWPQLYLQCSKCKIGNQRSMTAKEVVKYRKEQKAMFAHSKNLHRVWHAFCKKFQKPDSYGWKYEGYDFMERVEEYAKTHPEIVITCCDDNHFCSSDIVLIPHEADGQWMGVTVLVISQFGNPPVDFFLYPGHSQLLLDELFKIHKNQKYTQYAENKVEKGLKCPCRKK